MKHYPSLDGVRALAVGVVMLAHAEVPGVPSGWVGVDVFFALSGFLISSILLAEWDRHGSIILRYFYARRFLRLLPCLWLTVSAVLLVWTLAGRTNEVLVNAAYATTYTMNWARAFDWTDGGPLVHTWTLAIEEQYYLIWPLVIGLSCRFAKNRLALGWCLLGAAAADVVYRCALVGTFTNARIHTGLDTHADPMLIGSALACFVSTRWNRPLAICWSRLLGWVLAPAAVGVLVFVTANWNWSDGPPGLTIGYSVVGACTALIIIDATLGGHGLLRHLLELPILVWVGSISYGVYLWHYPIFSVLDRLHLHDWRLLLPAGVGLTLAVSAASYYLIARRFLELKRIFSRSASAKSAVTLPVKEATQEAM